MMMAAAMGTFLAKVAILAVVLTSFELHGVESEGVRA